MTTEESKALFIIWNWGGEVSLGIIAKEAGISINYAHLICESLGKQDYIDFIRSKLCKIKNKGKATVAGRSGTGPRKIIISSGKNTFGLGKNKKGRFVLNY